MQAHISLWEPGHFRRAVSLWKLQLENTGSSSPGGTSPALSSRNVQTCQTPWLPLAFLSAVLSNSYRGGMNGSAPWYPVHIAWVLRDEYLLNSTPTANTQILKVAGEAVTILFSDLLASLGLRVAPHGAYV